MVDMLELSAGEQPVRKSALRLRWFIRTFRDQVSRTSAETGMSYSIDDSRLAEVFAEWLRAFNAQKPDNDDDNFAYVGFAAGLMLRTLLRRQPATTAALPPGTDKNRPAGFWPEGYLYVSFCLNVRGTVIEKDFHGRQPTSKAIDDIAVWATFRENVGEDTAQAIAFLDLFAGEEPVWAVPDLFRAKRLRELAWRPQPREIVKPVD